MTTSQSPFGLLTDWDGGRRSPPGGTTSAFGSQSPFGLLTDWDLSKLARKRTAGYRSQSPFGLLTDWDASWTLGWFECGMSQSPFDLLTDWDRRDSSGLESACSTRVSIAFRLADGLGPINVDFAPGEHIVSIAFRLADGLGLRVLKSTETHDWTESQSPFGLLTDWDMETTFEKNATSAAASQSPFGLLTDWDRRLLSIGSETSSPSQSPFGLLTDWDFLALGVKPDAATSQSPFGLLTDWDSSAQSQQSCSPSQVSIAFRLADGLGHRVPQQRFRQGEGLNRLSAC